MAVAGTFWLASVLSSGCRRCTIIAWSPCNILSEMLPMLCSGNTRTATAALHGAHLATSTSEQHYAQPSAAAAAVAAASACSGAARRQARHDGAQHWHVECVEGVRAVELHFQQAAMLLKHDLRSQSTTVTIARKRPRQVARLVECTCSLRDLCRQLVLSE